MCEIVDTLRSEARWRPTIWGDARPLLLAAADEIERLRAAAGGEQGRGWYERRNRVAALLNDRKLLVGHIAIYDLADEIMRLAGGERGGEQVSPATETADTPGT